MSTYRVTLGERVLAVEVARAGDGYVVRVDGGPERRIGLQSMHGVLQALEVDEVRSEVMARVGGEGESTVVTLAGLEYRAEVVDEARARLASLTGRGGATHARRELKAPMPGLLVKVLVEVGATVEAGQPLAVLQAMKMENELSLPRGGTVTSVSVEPGQTVDQGQTLLTLE